MNRVLNFAVVTISVVVMASSRVDAAVVNITQGSTSGYTMTDGNTYVIQDSVSFSNSTVGGSGMSVADNATVILYVPAGVMLTATGANGNGQTGGGAGIRIPATSTLVITGEGMVNATGGNAGNGGNGSNGEAGASNYRGYGGAGGAGGGGAGAGIGGIGGLGGHASSGEAGGDGEDGESMGNVYLIGTITVSAIKGNAGDSGYKGDSGKSFFASMGGQNKWCYSGGGGGGGGGAGAPPTASIGGGGSAGGGGGSGGRGKQGYNSVYPGDGGEGGKSLTKAGESADRTNATGAGHGGAAGIGGDNGALYVSSMVTVDVEREKLSVSTHQAAQYTITFNVNGGLFASSVESLTATLGCVLPDCIPTPTRRGYLFDGWATVTDENYYGASGTKSISSYPIAGNLVLYAQWHLEEDTAVLPDSAFWRRENVETGWFVDSDVGEGAVLRSGQIGNSTNSWMETFIVGPASFSFDWKVSCNMRGHYLAWFIDGVEQARIRGEVDWTTVSSSIPEGEHVVRFDYVKGSTAAAGEDKGQVRNFSINPVRIETETMQVMWDWTTNYLVSVSTTGFGTADIESGWIADGSNVVVTVSPSIHSYSIVLSGDTDGVVLDGTNLTFQVCGAARSIAVSIDEVKPHLVVVSAQGTPTPAVGDHLFDSDAEVTVSVEAPDPAGGVRAVCTGWTGTGSVPASGEGDSVTFVITEDSSIMWNWATGYWVEFSIIGKGTTTYEAQWVAEGANLVIPFSVNTPFYSLSLSGDAEGAVLGDGIITVPITTPRSIVLNVTEYTYNAALDGGRLSWTSGGAVNWIPQGEVSHDGQDAVKSGEVTGDDVSTLSTVVTGPGTLAWWWKLEMSDCAGVDVFVDGAFVESLDTVSDWVSASTDIVGDGEHTVRFEFWNAGTTAVISDCAYLDQVSWTPEGGAVDYTVTTPDPVPYLYLDTECPTLLAQYGGDYEVAAKATAANGRNKVWECYVTGISPTNETARFTAKIEMQGDTPIVTWEPDLNTNGVIRTYKVYGSETLESGGNWQYPTNSLHRFFKVTVEMP